MSSTVTTSSGGTFTGHPKGLYLLFFTEMWERVCYYGMRALLALYVAAAFTQGQQSGAALQYGAFTALVYATGIFGGAIADRVLGYQRAILLGGVFIAGGEFLLLVKSKEAFLAGLALMVVGNGLFKPNISTMVGKLYQPGDPKRDQGFTIFYMGINLGAFIAPLFCDQIRVTFNATDPEGLLGFRYAFAAAGGGMLIGLANFLWGRSRLGEIGKPPKGKEGFGSIAVIALGGLAVTGLCYLLLSEAAILEYTLYALLTGVFVYILRHAAGCDHVQKQRLWVLLVLLVANIIFWAIFEQAGNSFSFFAENLVDRKLTDTFEFKTGWFQSVNPAFIVLLAPLFVTLWATLDKRGMNPSIPGKFGWALLQAGLGFLVLVVSAHFAYDVIFTNADGAMTTRQQTALWWLFLTYALHTTGELCLSPIGLSMVTKLAPAAMTGFVMGAWFMSISIGNFLAGKISAAIGSEGATVDTIKIADYVAVFSPIGWAMVALGVVMLFIAPKLNKWMHGVT